MRTINDFIDSIFDLKLKEDDGTDCLTLTNLILHRDIRHGGFNWGRPFAQKTPQQALHVAGEQAPTTFIHEAKQKSEGSKKAPEDNQQGPVDVLGQPMPPDGKIQTDSGEVLDLETNKMNPNIMSSLPQMNNCPAFFMKDMQSAPTCRVTNRVCIYLNPEYKNCGVYNLASTSDPSLWELPLGKEQSYSYIMGQKF